MAAPHARHTRRARTLLLLLTALAAALACHHLPAQDNTFLWDSIRLLQDMAPRPTQPCHHHRDALRFPDTLLQTHHPQQAAATALRILQHLFAVLSSPSTPQQWDDHARHRLLNSLQHYIHHLEKCLLANGTLSQGRRPRNQLLAINRYFADIQAFLRAHNHSACAWDHVRRRARACFRDVDTLLKQMKSQGASAPHKTHLRQRPMGTQSAQPQAEWRQTQPGLGAPSTSHSSARLAPAPTGK